MLRRTGFRGRLWAYLLVVSLTTALIVALIGWRSGRNALDDAIFDRITATRDSRASSIRSLFARNEQTVASLASDASVVEVTRTLGRSAAQIRAASVPADVDEQLDTFYDQTVAPQLALSPLADVDVRDLVPDDSVGRFLQYHYILKNPSDPDSRRDMVAADGDRTDVRGAHASIHTYLRTTADRMGFSDVFLIDLRTGRVMYTVDKDIDFGADLVNGPLADSPLGSIYRQVLLEPDLASVKVTDFESYVGAGGGPVSFMGAAIHDGTTMIGVLVAELSSTSIDRVMTSDFRWEASGQGRTGETYLVGPDRTMRSISRFLIEGPADYLSTTRERYGDEIADQIVLRSSSTLQQPVETDSADRALAGQTGTVAIEDYRGVAVLSAYAPAEIPGLNWAVISEVDQAEGLKPIEAFGSRVLMFSAILMLLLTIGAWIASARLVKPVRSLVDAARKVHEGDHSVRVARASDDEFGELADTFNGMVHDIDSRTRTLEEAQARRDALVRAVIPPSLVERLEQGTATASHLENVSVVELRLLDREESSAETEPSDLAASIRSSLTELDGFASELGLTRLASGGGTYLAACGLLAPNPDHAELAVAFAHRAVRRLGDGQEPARISGGIVSGSVVGGHMAGQRLSYEFFGEAVTHAHELARWASPQSIVVDRSTAELLDDTTRDHLVELDADTFVLDATFVERTPLAASTVEA